MYKFTKYQSTNNDFKLQKLEEGEKKHKYLGALQR